MGRRLEAGLLAAAVIIGVPACAESNSSPAAESPTASPATYKPPAPTRIDLRLPAKLPAAVRAMIPNAVPVSACADGKSELAICVDNFPASGYIVKPGVVRTAGHLYDQGAQPERCNSTAVLTSNSLGSNYITGGKVEYAGKIDLVPDRAVLHVDTSNSGAKKVRFDDPKKLKRGDTLFAIGYPWGPDTAASQTAFLEKKPTVIGLKFISREDGLLVLAEDLRDSYVGLKINSIYPGSSGSELVDSQGGVVGTIIDQTNIRLPQDEYDSRQVQGPEVLEAYAAEANRDDIAAMNAPVPACT